MKALHSEYFKTVSVEVTRFKCVLFDRWHAFYLETIHQMAKESQKYLELVNT